MSNSRIKWENYYSTIIDLKRKEKFIGASDICKALIDKYPELRNKDYTLMRKHLSRLISGKRGNLKELLDASKKDEPEEFISNKEHRENLDWREISKTIKDHQSLKRRLKTNQDHLVWTLNKMDKPPVFLVLGDTQLGSFGTDYEIFERMTEEILNTPNLYVILVGDIIQMAIKLRGVAEVLDNAISPSMQYYWLRSWLDEIKHKVVAATWCNHATMREEQLLGYSHSAKIFGDSVPYFKGIGEIDMVIGKQTYKVAASHFFRGKSMYNASHAPMRYMREEASHIEIAVQGDFHRPGILHQYFGGKERLAIVCGSFQTNSSYAKRFFSLKTSPNMPCFTLDPEKHMFDSYFSLEHYLRRNG